MIVRPIPMDDRHGREVLVTIAKITYAVSPAGVVTIAAEQAPIRLEDEPTGEDRWASVRYPGDAFDDKPGTDVLLVGTAYPPPGRAVTEFDVSLRVQDAQRAIQKTLRVYGPRVWYSGVLGVAPGPAAIAEPTPLVYERAFGGRDETKRGEITIDRRNPAGSGFALDRARLVGAPAPSIEDPRAPISSRTPAPAGFGPLAASWSPRAELAGTYDAAWARERAPLRPRDFDPRHASAAPADQWSATPLASDLAVEVRNATPEGAWRFRLPRYAPRFEAVIRGSTQALDTHLDTVLVDAGAGRVELSWRASVPLPKKSEHLEKVRVWGDGPIPDSILADLVARSLARERLEAS